MTGAVHAQEPRSAANFVYGSIPVTFAGNIGFKQPGVGGGGGGEFRLSANFAVTEDFQVVSERKRDLKIGKTVSSTTGAQYHFPRGFFVRTALQVSKLYDERKGGAVVRGRFGGGIQFLGNSGLPTARFTAEYFTPFKDDHGGRGVSVTGDIYYQLGLTPFAVGGKVGVNYQRFHPFSLPQFKQSGAYSTFEGRFVLNLTAAGGA